MIQPKSSLNPYASPFKPLSFSGISLEEECKTSESCDSGNIESVVDTPDLQLPGTVSTEYSIQSTEYLHVSDLSSTEVTHQAAETLQEEQEETIEWEDESGMDDFEQKIDYLTSRFPDFGRESLTAACEVNHGDVHETINMLLDLEEEDDEPETSESAATSDSLQHVDDSSESSIHDSKVIG